MSHSQSKATSALGWYPEDGDSLVGVSTQQSLVSSLVSPGV